MPKFLLPLVAVIAVCSSLPAFGQSDTPVDPQATWDLTDLFPSEAAWNKAREEVLADFDKIDARRGTLGESAESLYETHRLVSDTSKKANRVSGYASLKRDEDMRDSAGQERSQLAQIMFARFGDGNSR